MPIETGNMKDARLGHLTVSRDVGQSIVVGGLVDVRVVEARDGVARLRVTASKDVRVDRGESILVGAVADVQVLAAVDVQVVEAWGGVARLRVTAPKDVRVDRLEVHRARAWALARKGQS